jgi:hypothetical protein
MVPEFEWDPDKNRSNQQKHGLSFDEALTVFLDANANLMRDLDDSGEEDRFIILGLSSKHRILIVCHCYLESETVIRIISARKASPFERLSYDELL